MPSRPALSRPERGENKRDEFLPSRLLAVVSAAQAEEARDERVGPCLERNAPTVDKQAQWHYAGLTRTKISGVLKNQCAHTNEANE